jgi:hypothetical protein
MDDVIAMPRIERDHDLLICEDQGMAFQADMKANPVAYDDAYFAKVSAYENSPIARRVNDGRCAMLCRHLPLGTWVLDIGAGSGAFVRAAREAGFYVNGFDVMPAAVRRLKADQAYANDPFQFEAVTLWDTLEHMKEPHLALEKIAPGAWLFVSLPIFENLKDIRSSKHYRPGEHLYYWTADGLIKWAAYYGLTFIERSYHETEAGREDIGAFAFRRNP